MAEAANGGVHHGQSHVVDELGSLFGSTAPQSPVTPPAPRVGAGCRPDRARTGRMTRPGRTRRCVPPPTRSQQCRRTRSPPPTPRVAPASRASSRVSGISRAAGPTNTPAAPPRSTAANEPTGPPARLSSSPSVVTERHLVQSGNRDPARQAEQPGCRGSDRCPPSGRPPGRRSRCRAR